jgi:hypothetical protein
MPETITEKAVCAKCGADVREGTQFCYNCGSSLSEASSPELNGGPAVMDLKSQAALDDLAEKLKAEEESGDKLAKAAAERKRSRVSQRRRNSVVWEPSGDLKGGRTLVLAIIVFFATAFVVFVTIYWK